MIEVPTIPQPALHPLWAELDAGNLQTSGCPPSVPASGFRPHIMEARLPQDGTGQAGVYRLEGARTHSGCSVDRKVEGAGSEKGKMESNLPW